MGQRIASSTKWVSQEPFPTRIVEALMMKAGWMRFVQREEMMRNKLCRI